MDEVLYQNQVTSDKAAVVAALAAANGSRDEEKGVVILKSFQQSRNIWVALRALDVPWLCEVATALDLRGMKLENWEQLVNYWPTGAELEELEDHAFGRKVGELRNVEETLLPLLRIPDLKFRLRLLDLTQSMPVTMDQLSQQLACVQQACRELQDSESLRQFLAVTLVACTYLNTGTTAEDIKTDASVTSFFEVQQLTKLSEHKLYVSTEGVGLGMQQGMCLMHFMVKQMRLKFPDRTPARFEAELSCLERGRKQRLDEVKQAIQLLRTNLKGLEAQVTNVFGLPEASCGSDEEKDCESASERTCSPDKRTRTPDLRARAWILLCPVKARLALLQQQFEEAEACAKAMLDHFGVEVRAVPAPQVAEKKESSSSKEEKKEKKELPPGDPLAVTLQQTFASFSHFLAEFRNKWK
ncbi:unnamed protein product, partial [Effrenium voratum]